MFDFLLILAFLGFAIFIGCLASPAFKARVQGGLNRLFRRG